MWLLTYWNKNESYNICKTCVVNDIAGNKIAFKDEYNKRLAKYQEHSRIGEIE